MAACNQTDIPVLNIQEDPCIQGSLITSCIFYGLAIDYLGAQSSSSFFDVLGLIVAKLEAGNIDATNLEEDNRAQALLIEDLQNSIAESLATLSEIQVLLEQCCPEPTTTSTTTVAPTTTSTTTTTVVPTTTTSTTTTTTGPTQMFNVYLSQSNTFSDNLEAFSSLTNVTTVYLPGGQSFGQSGSNLFLDEALTLALNLPGNGRMWIQPVGSTVVYDYYSTFTGSTTYPHFINNVRSIIWAYNNSGPNGIAYRNTLGLVYGNYYDVAYYNVADGYQVGTQIYSDYTLTTPKTSGVTINAVAGIPNTTFSTAQQNQQINQVSTDGIITSLTAGVLNNYIWSYLTGFSTVSHSGYCDEFSQNGVVVPPLTPTNYVSIGQTIYGNYNVNNDTYYVLDPYWGYFGYDGQNYTMSGGVIQEAYACTTTTIAPPTTTSTAAPTTTTTVAPGLTCPEGFPNRTTGNGTMTLSNGVTLTTTYTGPTLLSGNFNPPFTACGNSFKGNDGAGGTMYLNYTGGAFTLTLTFSQPQSHIAFGIFGMGIYNQPGTTESYTFTTNGGGTQITELNGCGNFQVQGFNTLVGSNNNGTASDGSGAIQVTSSGLFTEVTITGNNSGSLNGVGIDLYLCSNLIIE